MKEDILEQLVDDFLQHRGYFTQHNVKFRPRSDHPDFVKREDSNHSDIDVLGVHPRKRGRDAVWAVSCKSWQAGFSVESKLTEIAEDKVRSGRKAWKAFRELVQPKWSEAFRAKVNQLTGRTQFTHVTAVTRLKGDPERWQQHASFREAMAGNPVRLISLDQMLEEMLPELGTTMAPSHLGRTLQLLKAAGFVSGPPPPTAHS